jgi:hypothetical protein
MGVTDTSHFQIIARLLGGDLPATLTLLYAETGSWEGVSRALYAEHQIVVSGQTLRRWAKELGIGADEAKAATA